jgi:hypothetical protein
MEMWLRNCLHNPEVEVVRQHVGHGVNGPSGAVCVEWLSGSGDCAARADAETMCDLRVKTGVQEHL